MPSLAIKFDPNANGPIIPIGLNAPNSPIAIDARAFTIYQALIDTGATKTCISAECAKAVGLTPLGKAPMMSATGVHDKFTYLADVGVQFGLQLVVLQNVLLLEFECDPGLPFQ